MRAKRSRKPITEHDLKTSEQQYGAIFCIYDTGGGVYHGVTGTVITPDYLHMFLALAIWPCYHLFLNSRPFPGGLIK